MATKPMSSANSGKPRYKYVSAQLRNMLACIGYSTSFNPTTKLLTVYDQTGNSMGEALTTDQIMLALLLDYFKRVQS